MPNKYESRLSELETQLTNLSHANLTQSEAPPIICHIQGFNEDNFEYDATINALYNERSRGDGRNRSREMMVGTAPAMMAEQMISRTGASPPQASQG